MINRAITAAGILTMLVVGGLTGYNEPPQSFLVEVRDGLIFGDRFERESSATVGNGWSQAGEVAIGSYYLEREQSGIILHDDFERTIGPAVGNGWICTGTNADCDLRDYYFSQDAGAGATAVVAVSLPEGWWMQQADQPETRVYEAGGMITLYPSLCTDEDYQLGEAQTLKTIKSVDCDSTFTYTELPGTALSICGDLEQNMGNCTSSSSALVRYDFAPPTTAKPGAVLSRVLSRNALYYYSLWGTIYQYGQYPNWSNDTIYSLLRNSNISVSGSATLSLFDEEYATVLSGVSRGDEMLRLYSDTSGRLAEMGEAASVASVEWGQMPSLMLAAGSGELLIEEVYWLAALDVKITGLPANFSAEAKGHPSTKTFAENGVAYVNPGPYYELEFPLCIYDSESQLVAEVSARRGDNWLLHQGNYLLTWPLSATAAGDSSVYRDDLAPPTATEPQMIYLEIEQLDLSQEGASLTVYAGAASSPDGGLIGSWLGGTSYLATAALTVDPGENASLSANIATNNLPAALAIGVDRAGLLKFYRRTNDVWSLLGSVSTGAADWQAVYPYFGLTASKARAAIGALYLTRALDIEVGQLPDGYAVGVAPNPGSYAEENEGTARLDPARFAADGISLQLRNPSGNSEPTGGNSVGVHPGAILELVE